MKDVERRFVGIDLAKRSYVAHFAQRGTDRGRIFLGKTDPKGLARLYNLLAPVDKVALESCALGCWLARSIIENVGCEVLVLNAGDLAIIYRSTKKTDLNDAEKLAWILKRFPTEELPIVPLPNEKEESRRAMVSELHSKRRLRTMQINRLHSLFTRVGQTNMKKSHMVNDYSRRKCVQSLAGQTLIEALRLLDEISLIEKHIESIRIEMARTISDDQNAENLLSMPGVGIDTAIAFLAYIGDGQRFSNGRQVANYVGMTPKVYSSGETVRVGHISKRGCKALRSIIVQSAWGAIHCKRSNVFKTKYEELVQRVGKKRAIVAIARRMLETMWLLVTRDETFRGYDELSRHLKILKINRMVKKQALVA